MLLVLLAAVLPSGFPGVANFKGLKAELVTHATQIDWRILALALVPLLVSVIFMGADILEFVNKVVVIPLLESAGHVLSVALGAVGGVALN